jgi:hypothetical protein
VRAGARRTDDGYQTVSVKPLSDLCGLFRIGFADRGVGILRWLYGFLDGRRGGLGWGAELECVWRGLIRLHGIQMPKLREWKLVMVVMISGNV